MEKENSCGLPRMIRAVIASNSSSTARQIAEEAGASDKCKERLSKNCEHSKRRKLQRKPWSNQERKLCRNLQRNINCADKKMARTYICRRKEVEFRRT